MFERNNLPAARDRRIYQSVEPTREEKVAAYAYANEVLSTRYGDPVDPMAFYQELYKPDLYIVSPEDSGVPYQQFRERGEYKRPQIRIVVMPDGKDPVPDKRKNSPWNCASDLAGIADALRLANECPGSKIALSPCSYIGHRMKQQNVVYVHACVIDIDTVLPHNVNAILRKIESKEIPCPTFLACSGSGLHAYFVFDSPVNLKFEESSLDEMNAIKRSLTYQFWTPETSSKGSAEYLPIVQSIRMVGSRTKQNQFVTVYRTGDSITLSQYRSSDTGYDDQPPYAEFRKRQRLESEQIERERVESQKNKRKYTKGKPINHSRDVYDDFLGKASNQATIGKRYNCMRALTILEAQCGVCEEELYSDLKNLQRIFNSASEEPVTDEEVNQAMTELNDPSVRRHRYNYLESISGITILRNPKRQFNKRPDNAARVAEWQTQNPKGNKSECSRDLELSRTTVLKYWDETKSTVYTRNKIDVRKKTKPEVS